MILQGFALDVVFNAPLILAGYNNYRKLLSNKQVCLMPARHLL